jgi:tetratricopeptide (TPR) repeat protein
MFNRGGQAYQSGDYAEAEGCFKQVVGAASSNELLADAFLWRGRACLELGRDPEAVRYIGKAAELRPDGKTFAYHAYACARERSFTGCINRSRKAIDAGFVKEAALYNNLAFAHLRRGEFDHAVSNLDRAIRLEPGLIPIYYNRAMVELYCAAQQQRPVEPQAGEDIDKVIKCGSDNPYTYYDAALIYFRLDEDPNRHVVDYLCRALRLGISPERVRESFPSLVHDPRIKGEKPTVSVKRRSPVDQLADPFPNQPFPFREP